MGMSSYIMGLESDYVDAVERLIDQIDNAGALLLLMDRDCTAPKNCKCPRHHHLHQFMLMTSKAVGDFRKVTK